MLVIAPDDVYETDAGWHAHGTFVSWASLSSPDGEPWPILLYPRLRALLNEYGWICRLAGTSFPVYSGYRSYFYQDTFHASSRVTHPHGYALDIVPVANWTVARMAVYARRRWAMPDSVLTGIGVCPEWLHIDIHPRTTRRQWRGARFRPD